MSGLFGGGGGAAGTGFAGPSQAAIDNPVTKDQLSGAYSGSQNSIAAQQALLQALQAQGGIGNQSQVYGQLQGIANGTGPNPAQAMLANTTGQNVANQAALMAGQRGAGSNVGLMARQIGQQGAGIQQNAAGQAAALQAQQSLNAIGAAGNMANQQVANQIGATGANTNANLAEQQALLNAQSSYNNAVTGSQENVNSINGALIGNQLQGQQGLIGGILGGVGAAAGLGGASKKAEGGMISYADGGAVPNVTAAPLGSPVSSALQGPQGIAANFLAGMGGNPGAQALNSGMTKFGAGMGQAFAPRMNAPAPINNSTMAGGAMDSQAALNPDVVMAACGGSVGQKLKSGGGVPGKAKVAGNSYSNDTVNAKLSPGELVVDRETMNDPGAAGQAARFVAAAIAHKKGKKK